MTGLLVWIGIVCTLNMIFTMAQYGMFQGLINKMQGRK